MKKSIGIGITALFLGLVFTACYNDKGNYDYQKINEIAIGNLGERHDLVYKSDTLKIEPDLWFTDENREDERYVFEWKAVPEFNNANPGGVIGHERNLKWPVELLPGMYYLYFKVFDKETGLMWREYTEIDIKTAVSKGFLLIGENRDGSTGVEMISLLEKDTVVIYDLMKDNGLPLLNGPRNIIHTGSSKWDAKIWVMTDEGSYYVNTSTFQATMANDFQSLIYTTYPLPSKTFPVDVAPRVNKETGQPASNSSRLVLCENGYSFFADLYSADIYANPTNRSSKAPEEFFEAFPTIIYSPGAWNYYMLYDQDQDRFLRASSTATAMTELADKEGDKFPWNQAGTGRKLVYVENTRNNDGSTYGSSFALMKDSDNHFYIYKMYAHSGSKINYYEIDPAVQLADVHIFAFASQRTFMFFAVGSVLYIYDYQNKQLKNQDLGDEITMLKFDIQRGTEHYNDLYIATYNESTGGKLQVYTLDTNPNHIAVTPNEACCWKNLIKIKTMDWRNSVY